MASSGSQLKNLDEEDEFERIMNQTYTNNDYCDQEIADLVLMPVKVMVEDQLSRTDSSQSVDHRPIVLLESEEDAVYEPQLLEPEPVHDQAIMTVLDKIEQEQLRNYTALPYSEVEKKYSLHLLKNSQNVRLEDNYITHVPAHINAYLKKNRKEAVGAEVFFENQQRTFIVWTSEGEIVIFYPLTLKNVAFKPFESGISMARICQELQYLVVASKSLELAIYRLREPICIENKRSYRFLNQPQLLHTINSDQLKCNIVGVEFIPSGENGVVQFMAVDQFDEVSIHLCKKKLWGYKTQIDLLPLVFEDVFEVKVTTIEDVQSPSSFTIAAISSQQAVTLCIVKPHFELLFVYHQSNRENVVKQGRFAHIDFHKNRLLIVWDKYLEVVGIDMLQTSPVQFNIRTLNHFFMAETSLSVGFLSDTLLYQFSRSGLRVYSSNKFLEGSGSGSSHHQPRQLATAQIYIRELSLDAFPETNQMTSDLLGNPQPPLGQLKRLGYGISTTIRNKLNFRLFNHHSMVYIYNGQLESLQFVPYTQYLSKIESEGHWKMCLSLLKGIYEGTVYELDCIRAKPALAIPGDPDMKRLKIECQQNVERYLERLFVLVSQENKSPSWNQREIQSQQLLFLCDFLLRTDNSRFMMEEVAGRCSVRGLPFFQSLEPFILLKRVTDIGCANIEIVFERYSIQVLSKLVYSLDLQANAMHIVKSLLLRKGMLQEFLYVSVREEDYYTPFVVLVALYKETHAIGTAHLLLYYIRKCLLGESVPEGRHSRGTHKLIVKEVILRVLQPPVYQLFLEQTFEILFEQTLPKLFSDKCLPQLNELESDSEVCDYFQVNDLEPDIIRNLIIRNLPIPGEQDAWLGHYQRFLLDLFVRSLLVDYPVVNGLAVALHKNELSIELVNRVIAMPEFDRQLAKYSKLDPLLESLVGSEYVEFRAKLLLIKEREVEATRLLLSSSRTNVHIFHHLHAVLPYLSSAKLHDMSLLLKQEIRLLASLDIGQLQEILTRYFAQEQNMFIGVLQPYPELQLELISAILGNSREDRDLRVRYLQLLTKLGRFDAVEQEIFKDLYPLDESLELCQRFKLHNSQAYLYERLGDVNRSVRMHFLVRIYVTQVADQQLQKLEPNWSDTRESMQAKISDILNGVIDNCLRICRNVSQRGVQEWEVHWFVVVEELEKLKQPSRSLFMLIRNAINGSVYPRVFQQIITNVELTSILRYIQDNFNRLQFSIVRDSFILLIKAYSYEKEMMFKCRDMMMESVDDSRDLLLSAYRKGFHTTGVCNVCSGDEDLLIRYPCRHQIHPYCSKDIKICGICLLEDDSFQITQTVMKQEIGQFNILKSDSRIQPLRISRRPRRNILIDYDVHTGELTEDMRLQLSGT